MDWSSLRAVAKLETLWEKVIPGSEAAQGRHTGQQGEGAIAWCPPKHGGPAGLPPP